MSEQPIVEIVPIESLQPDPNNANRGTERGSYMLNDSLKERGAGRSILATGDGVILAGNKTHEQAVQAGFTEVIKVHTNGKQLVAVVRDDLEYSDPDAQRLALEDNRINQVSLNFDPTALLARAQEDPTALDGLWSDDEVKALLKGASDDDEKQAGVPDSIFESDNEFDIPLLDIGLQPDKLVLPLTRWGEIGRKSKMAGTYHFYTDDYKFQALWDDPRNLMGSECSAIIEPNFSNNDAMPVAVGLWGIYRKRWLARYAQTFGIRVWVDLNVSAKFAEYNLLGVPKGWQSFCTRGLNKYIDFIVSDYEIACKIAEPNEPRFLVYGGGQACAALCAEKGFEWLPENMRVKADGLRGYDYG